MSWPDWSTAVWAGIAGWATAGIAVFAIVASFLLRPRSHISFTDAWEVDYASHSDFFVIEVVVNVAQPGLAYMVKEATCKLRSGGKWHKLVAFNAHIGEATEAHQIGFQFRGENEWEPILPDDLVDVFVKLRDGASRRRTRLFSTLKS